MTLYRFDEFDFDSTTGELRQTGRRVPLRPQPAKALGHLVERQGQLVNRRELQRAIWPDDTFVHFDHGLNSCMKQIRAALDDNRSSPRYVETLVRRGFRFIAPVVVVRPEERGVVGAEAWGEEFLVQLTERVVREVLTALASVQ